MRVCRSIRLFVLLVSALAGVQAGPVAAENVATMKCRCEADKVEIRNNPVWDNECAEDGTIHPYRVDRVELKTDTESQFLDEFRLERKETLRDAEGNTYHFIEIDPGGNCGNKARLVTSCRGKIMTYVFWTTDVYVGSKGSCSEWNILGENRIMSKNPLRYSGRCRLSSRAHEPRFPVVFTIEGCSDNGIRVSLTDTVDGLLEEEGGMGFLEDFVATTAINVRVLNSREDIERIEDPVEREFCRSLYEGEPDEKIIDRLRKLEELDP